MKQTWIVVAESTRARIFSTFGTSMALEEVADLTHPESRLHDRELSSDLPGRSFDSHGQGRHGMEQPTTPKEQEAQAFASEIVQLLDRGRHEGSFNALVIVAPPAFLGLLRSKLDKPLEDLVASTLNKNLVEADKKTLERQISALLR